MESTETKSLELKFIEIRTNREVFLKKEYDDFKKTLTNYNIPFEITNSSKFITIKLPVALIFYVEYLKKDIIYYLKLDKITSITDSSNISLTDNLSIINREIDDRNMSSKFIRIMDCFLIRIGDIKGYDNNTDEIIIRTVSHIFISKKIRVGRVFKKSLFEILEDVNKSFLSVKSVNNITHIVNPLDIKCVINKSKYKKIYVKIMNDSFVIEVKYSESSKKVDNTFNDEWNMFLKHGSLMRFNRSTIFNLEFFEKKNLVGDNYLDPDCGSIKVYKKLIQGLLS